MVKNAYRIPFLVILTFLLSSCGNPMNSFFELFESDKTFFRSNSEIVQIVDQDPKASPNQHPINIDAGRIEGALHLILLKRANTTFPLFNNKKRYILANTISKALKKANSRQDIIFSIEDWYKDPNAEKGFFNVSENNITSGRVFFLNNKLNIIFGSIMRKGEMSDDPMIRRINPDYDSNPYAPGSRNFTFRNNWILATPPNSGVFKPKVARNRMDWLVFTIKALQPRGETTNTERLQARQSNIEVRDLRAEVQQLRNELRQQLRPTNQYTPPQYQYQYPQTYAYPPGYQYPNQYDTNNRYNQSYQNNDLGNSQNQIRRQELESLRERGLISQEQFLEQLRISKP